MENESKQAIWRRLVRAHEARCLRRRAFPGSLVERADGERRQLRLAGDKDEGLAGLRLLEADAAQVSRSVLLAVEAIEGNGLVAQDARRALDLIAETHVAELPGLRRQADLDFARALAKSRFCEGHDMKLPGADQHTRPTAQWHADGHAACCVTVPPAPWGASAGVFGVEAPDLMRSGARKALIRTRPGESLTGFDVGRYFDNFIRLRSSLMPPPGAGRRDAVPDPARHPGALSRAAGIPSSPPEEAGPILKYCCNIAGGDCDGDHSCQHSSVRGTSRLTVSREGRIRTPAKVRQGSPRHPPGSGNRARQGSRPDLKRWFAGLSGAQPDPDRDPPSNALPHSKPATEFTRMHPQSGQILPFPQSRVRRPPPLSVEFSTQPEAGHEEGRRWTRLRITVRDSGDFLCEKVRGPSPLDVDAATVESLEQARRFFGGGWIVKELFASLDPVRFPRWS